MKTEQDKAGDAYWENVWKESELQLPIIPESKSINNYFNHIAHNYFKKQFKNLETKNKKILEVGCGNSVWLPYFAKEFGMQLYGLDYSEIGCSQERKILEREKLAGTIYCADLFSTPQELLNSFDFVVSFGVVEHFKDTSQVIKQLSLFLKPGGTLITFIPNLTGLYGWLQKHFNRPVYDIHNPIDKDDLKNAIQKSGLEITSIQYAGSIGLSLNLEGIEKNIFYFPKKLSNFCLSRFCKIFWLIDFYLFPLPVLKPFAMAVFSFAKNK